MLKEQRTKEFNRKTSKVKKSQIKKANRHVNVKNTVHNIQIQKYKVHILNFFGDLVDM